MKPINQIPRMVYGLLVLASALFARPILGQQIFKVSDYGAVGDGVADDGPELRAAFSAAMAHQGPAVLSFDPKIYRIGRTGATHFTVDGKQDKTIEGNGATLLLASTMGLLNIRSSQNIRISGLTIDYDSLTWTQGTVTAVDIGAGAFDVDIHEGFPIPEDIALPMTQNSFGCVFDPVEPLLKDGVSDHIKIEKMTRLGNGKVRFTATADYVKYVSDIEAGDRFVKAIPSSAAFPINIGANLIAVSASGDITFEQMTIYTSIALVFVPTENDGPLFFRNINMIPKPGTARLISGYRDGFHFVSNRVGPVVENCVIQGLLDDAINMRGPIYYVQNITSPTRFTLSGVNARLHVGDTLIFTNFSPGKELAKVIVTERPSANEVVVDRPVEGLIVGTQADKAATRVFNINLSNPGYIIRNNTFKGQRRFAMLIRSPNGLIEGNKVTNRLSTGIYFSNEIATFFEGPLPYNVMVRNNSFEHCRPVFLGASVYSSPTFLVHDIVFEGNLFSSHSDSRPVDIRNARGITFRDNQFISSGPTALSLTNDTLILLQRNTFNGKLMESVSDGIILANAVTKEDVVFDNQAVSALPRPVRHLDQIHPPQPALLFDAQGRMIPKEEGRRDADSWVRPYDRSPKAQKFNRIYFMKAVD